MILVSILPVSTESGRKHFQAVAGAKQSKGHTAGEALDALTAQLSDEETGTLVILQSFKPDRFFNAAQQQRLTELMGHWRQARDRGESFPEEEQAELDALVEAELLTSADRAALLADQLGK